MCIPPFTHIDAAEGVFFNAWRNIYILRLSAWPVNGKEKLYVEEHSLTKYNLRNF